MNNFVYFLTQCGTSYPDLIKDFEGILLDWWALANKRPTKEAFLKTENKPKYVPPSLGKGLLTTTLFLPGLYSFYRAMLGLAAITHLNSANLDRSLNSAA